MNGELNNKYCISNIKIILFLLFLLFLLFFNGCGRKSPSTSISNEPNTLKIYGFKNSTMVSPYSDMKKITFNKYDYSILRNYILYHRDSPHRTANENYNIALDNYNFLHIRGYRCVNKKIVKDFLIAYNKDKHGFIIYTDNQTELIKTFNQIISKCHYSIDFKDETNIYNYIRFFRNLDIKNKIIKIKNSDLLYDKNEKKLYILLGTINYEVSISKVLENDYNKINKNVHIGKIIKHNDDVISYEYSGVDSSHTESIGIVKVNFKIKRNGEILSYNIKDIYRTNRKNISVTDIRR